MHLRNDIDTQSRTMQSKDMATPTKALNTSVVSSANMPSLSFQQKRLGPKIRALAWSPPGILANDKSLLACIDSTNPFHIYVLPDEYNGNPESILIQGEYRVTQEEQDQLYSASWSPLLSNSEGISCLLAVGGKKTLSIYIATRVRDDVEFGKIKTPDFSIKKVLSMPSYDCASSLCWCISEEQYVDLLVGYWDGSVEKLRLSADRLNSPRISERVTLLKADHNPVIVQCIVEIQDTMFVIIAKGVHLFVYCFSLNIFKRFMTPCSSRITDMCTKKDESVAYSISYDGTVMEWSLAFNRDDSALNLTSRPIEIVKKDPGYAICVSDCGTMLFVTTSWERDRQLYKSPYACDVTMVPLRDLADLSPDTVSYHLGKKRSVEFFLLVFRNSSMEQARGYMLDFESRIDTCEFNSTDTNKRRMLQYVNLLRREYLKAHGAALTTSENDRLSYAIKKSDVFLLGWHYIDIIKTCQENSKYADAKAFIYLVSAWCQVHHAELPTEMSDILCASKKTLLKISPPDTEVCILCSKATQVDVGDINVCEDGHKLVRCCVSLATITEPGNRECRYCRRTVRTGSFIACLNKYVCPVCNVATVPIS
eukprot:TRINITY_DN7854_c0_g1_i1.p1 TRINITY_DN7854_c0_g1~~TRINITY_DN7854_c0_g1_i1.p1  ORF type:complete len:595 (-),score=77.21 TRINITY_DN7854_c0_g1_i1:299-2083(-)